MRPSNTSRTNAAGAIAAAQKKCDVSPFPTCDIASNTIAMPQAAFPSVKKSARWKSRSIEK
jgi:hypothetical protein